MSEVWGIFAESTSLYIHCLNPDEGRQLQTIDKRNQR